MFHQLYNIYKHAIQLNRKETLDIWLKHNLYIILVLHDIQKQLSYNHNSISCF